MVGSLDRLVSLTQDALQALVGGGRRLGAMAGRSECGLQLAHLGAVLPGSLSAGHKTGDQGTSCGAHGCQACFGCTGQRLTQAAAGLLCLFGSVREVVHLSRCLVGRLFSVRQLSLVAGQFTGQCFYITLQRFGRFRVFSLGRYHVDVLLFQLFEISLLLADGFGQGDVLAALAQLLDRLSGLLGGPFIAVQLLRGGDNLTLEGADLLRRHFAAFKLRLDLLFRFFQRLQPSPGGLHRFRQDLLLLGQQVSVARVHFQQLVNLPQLTGQAARLPLDVLQGLAQFRGVAADFHGQAFDFAISH